MDNEVEREDQLQKEIVTVPAGLTPTMPRVLMTLTEAPAQSRVDWESKGRRPGR